MIQHRPLARRRPGAAVDWLLCQHPCGRRQPPIPRRVRREAFALAYNLDHERAHRPAAPGGDGEPLGRRRASRARVGAVAAHAVRARRGHGRPLPRIVQPDAGRAEQATRRPGCGVPAHVARAIELVGGADAGRRPATRRPITTSAPRSACRRHTSPRSRGRCSPDSRRRAAPTTNTRRCSSSIRRARTPGWSSAPIATSSPRCRCRCG